MIAIARRKLRRGAKMPRWLAIALYLTSPLLACGEGGLRQLATPELDDRARAAIRALVLSDTLALDSLVSSSTLKLQSFAALQGYARSRLSEQSLASLRLITVERATSLAGGSRPTLAYSATTDSLTLRFSLAFEGGPSRWKAETITLDASAGRN